MSKSILRYVFISCTIILIFGCSSIHQKIRGVGTFSDKEILLGESMITRSFEISFLKKEYRISARTNEGGKGFEKFILEKGKYKINSSESIELKPVQIKAINLMDDFWYSYHNSFDIVSGELVEIGKIKNSNLREVTRIGLIDTIADEIFIGIKLCGHQLKLYE